MRALRNFVLHDGNGNHRWFKVGETVPPEWLERIGASSLVDGPLPGQTPGEDSEPGDGGDSLLLAGLKSCKTIEDVTTWALSPTTFEERFERSRMAYDYERAGRARKGLLETLAGILSLADPVPADGEDGEA